MTPLDANMLILGLARTRGDSGVIFRTCSNIAALHLTDGNSGEAALYLKEAGRLAGGDVRALAVSYTRLGGLHVERGEGELANAALSEARELFGRCGDKANESMVGLMLDDDFDDEEFGDEEDDDDDEEPFLGFE